MDLNFRVLAPTTILCYVTCFPLVLPSDCVGDDSAYFHQDGSCDMFCSSQLFGPLSLLVKGLLSPGPTPSSFYLLVEMGLSLLLFPAYMR